MADGQTPEVGAQFLLVAACAVVIVAGLKAAASLILPLLIALFLAMISMPLLNWMRRRKVPTPLAVLSTIAITLLLVSLVVVLIGGSIREFTAEADKYRSRLELLSGDLVEALRARGIQISRQLVTDLVNPAQAMDLVTGTLLGVYAILTKGLLVLLTVVFILSEAAGFPAKLEAALGPGSGRFANIQREIQRYLAIKTLVSLATGSLVAAALAIIGVDFPLLWGMVAFMLNYIPTLGSILAAIPPVSLALLQLGPGHALAVGISFLVVNLALGNFIEPHLLGRKLGLSTLVIFLSLVFWGWVWGPVGMFLSVPLTVIVKIMLENTPDLRWVAVMLDASPATMPPAVPPGPAAG